MRIPRRPKLQQLGDAWLRSGASAVLEVPSAVIANEPNYLLNPQYQDFASIARSAPQRFELDLRLLSL